MNATATQKHDLTSQDFLMSQLQSADMPNDLMTTPLFLRLDHLLIENFKSFKQKTFTGPFLNFTSIVGPNGSGKSNVLDALIFCLCGQNFKHNFFDIREYINREKAQSYKDMSKKKKICSVQAKFVLQNDQTTTLKRQLDPQRNEYYYIDQSEVPKKVYQNFLFKQGLNPHIPNYAITQGQIDKVLLKEPIELAKYIENLSGSFLLRRDYDLVKGEIQQVRKVNAQMSQKIITLKKERKNAKDINEASKECESLETQYEEIVNKLFLGKIFLKEIDLAQMEEAIAIKKNQEKKMIDEINKRKLKIQEQLRQKQELNKEINAIEKNIIELHSKLKTINAPDLILKQKQLENQENDLQSLQNQFKKLMDKKDHLQQSLPQIHSSQIIEQYLKLYSLWQMKNKELNFELQNKKALYFNLEGQRQFQRQLLQSEQQKQRDYREEDEKRKRDIDFSNQQIVKIDLTINKLLKQNQDAEKGFKKNQALMKDLQHEFQKTENQLQNIEELLTENVETAKDKEIVKRLSLVDGFMGIIEQKIRPKNTKYIVAFSILTSSISKFLLCKDQLSSKQISDKLKSINALKTLIILSNVKKPNSNDSIKANVGKNGTSALQIIDFDSNFLGLDFFLQQFCRGKIICENLQQAFQIRNKKVPGLREIITLEGEVIKNDGSITSCGNTDHIKRLYKIGSNKKSLQGEFQKMTLARDELKLKIQKLENSYKQEDQIRRIEQISRLQRKKEDLKTKIKFLSEIKPKQVKSYKAIEKDISILTDKLQKVQKQISSIERNMSSDKQMSQFMKKYAIDNLQSFRSASNLEFLEKQTKRKNQLIRLIDDMNGTLLTLKDKIDSRSFRITILKNDLNYMVDSKNKHSIEMEVQQNQKKLKELRQKSSKLGVFRDSDIQLRSQVIEMETKFKFFKQKIRENAEDLKVELGVTINYPRIKDEWRPLEQYISEGALDGLSQKKIQRAVKNLEIQKNQCEEKLQKLTSINLLSKKDQKDQADLAQEIKELTDLFSNNITKKLELEKKLEEIKNQRKNIFMEFFHRAKETLKRTYELLTETSEGQVGKADLYMQNSEFPFEHGIYFTPTPPKKRFVYDLDQLSGGQKSIASLALQYALAKCSRSPFLILDESDAYLDSSNTVKLLKLVEESSKDRKLQVILVTHKSTVYTRCESLVGVCRPKHQFSKILSIRVK